MPLSSGNQGFAVAVSGKADLRYGKFLPKIRLPQTVWPLYGRSHLAGETKMSSSGFIIPNYSLYLRFSKEAREVYALTRPD